MAIYNAGYLSPIRKKLGNAVGRKWRNLDVLAVYQPFVHNPNTDSQKSVRSRFGAAATLAMHMAAAVEMGFEATCRGTKIPQRSMFIKKNWSEFLADTPTHVTVDYTELKLSAGGLTVPSKNGNLDFSDPLSVNVAFNAYSGESTATIDKDDVVVVVAFDPTANMCYLKEGSRDDNGVTVSVDMLSNGNTVYVYAFAIGGGSLTLGKASETVYLGSGTIS